MALALAALPALAVGGFGMLIGSFLNVVVYRVPIGMSIVSPPSACPGCGSAIAPRDNVPVLSWALLRGACRGCRMPISVRYPLVELLTGVAFAVVAARFLPVLATADDAQALTAGALELVAYLFLAAISIALAAIDLDTRRLPDAIVLPAYAVGVALLGGADLLRGDLAAFGLALAGAGAAFALYLALALAKPGGMGLGDVKLAGVLGLFLGHLGIAQLAVGVAGGFLLGGLAGVALLVSRRASRSTAIPFGPWMLAGAWLGVLVGEPLATDYLRLTGLA